MARAEAGQLDPGNRFSLTVIKPHAKLEHSASRDHPYPEKHHVATEEVEQVFDNRPVIKRIVKGHFRGEDVYRLLGQSEAGRYLVVFFIYKQTGDALWRKRMSETQATPSNDLPTSIGKPATRALVGAGYTRLEQLTGVTEADLLKLHGVGPKALRILREALAAQGLSFAG